MTAFALPLVIPYPQIDPVLVQLGPLAIRWYALAYIAGIVLGWRYLVMMSRNARLWIGAPGNAPPAKPADVDDILVAATLGIVLGGRLGYILFYGLVYSTDYYLENPLRIFAVWQGGMSFHGGLLGVVLATWIFARTRKLDFLRVGDLLAPVVPIGLFFGRLANFINGELFGRVTDAPWAMVFCNTIIRNLNGGACPAGLDPRHPSQLYEAALEGLALLLVMRFVTHHTKALAKPGLVSGIFLAGYGVARVICEFFREPENPLGHSGLTMGMLLSGLMWIGAAALIWNALRAKAPTTPPP